MFPNSAIFPVNKIAKTVICDKSLKPSFLEVNVLSSKIKLLSLIFEVVERIFVCQKISIVANIDTVKQVSTSGSGSLTVLFCGTTIYHEVLCDDT